MLHGHVCKVLWDPEGTVEGKGLVRGEPEAAWFSRAPELRVCRGLGVSVEPFRKMGAFDKMEIQVWAWILNKSLSAGAFPLRLLFRS